MILPHGGILINQILDNNAKKESILKAKSLQKIILSPDKVNEVKNIARGLLSPLSGFMTSNELKSVANMMTLRESVTFPLPVLLDIPEKLGNRLKIGQEIALIDSSHSLIATMTIHDKFTFHKQKIAEKVFGSTDVDHPGVRNLYALNNLCIGGPIFLINNDKTPWEQYNLDPKETRYLFAKKSWSTIAGFQTRNVVHRGHEFIHKQVLSMFDGLFINPVVGEKKKGDFTDEMTVESYQNVLTKYYPKGKTVFSVLPYKMQYAGPREAVMHAIIRKNFGCTHFIIGRDHAGVGSYYGPYDAQKIFDTITDIGLTIIKMSETFFCYKCKEMVTSEICNHKEKDIFKVSGTYIRSQIVAKKSIPETIMRPEVSKMLLLSKNPFV